MYSVFTLTPQGDIEQFGQQLLYSAWFICVNFKSFYSYYSYLGETEYIFKCFQGCEDLYCILPRCDKMASF
jgi:hypothetical protein